MWLICIQHRFWPRRAVKTTALSEASSVSVWLDDPQHQQGLRLLIEVNDFSTPAFCACCCNPHTVAFVLSITVLSDKITPFNVDYCFTVCVRVRHNQLSTKSFVFTHTFDKVDSCFLDRSVFCKYHIVKFSISKRFEVF